MNKNQFINGRVTDEQKNFYLVMSERGEIRTRIKGILRKNNQRVYAGDLVTVELINENPLEGLICKIEKRTSFLKKPSIANITQLFFVNTYRQPEIDYEALDRFLVQTEYHQIKPIIVFNKIDLLDKDEIEELATVEKIYQTIGYIVCKVSAQTGENVSSIKDLLAEQISAFAGLSGVGKSSLMSFMYPEYSFRISELAISTGRGAHTTTSVTLLPTELNGYIADTPGFAYVDLPLMEPDEIVGYFPEISAFTGECRFNNCKHADEPGCVVREKVELKEIAEWRWYHYLKFHDELIKKKEQSYR